MPKIHQVKYRNLKKTLAEIKMNFKMNSTFNNVDHYSSIYDHQAIGLISRVFASGRGSRGSILCRVILKTQKMVLDAALLNTQHYKGKVEQSREWSSALPNTSVC